MEPDAVELRVVGCLVEKQRTTPDVYPLSLNSLRLACNQATNRDPVVEYDEATIRGALERLSRRGWTRLASGPGSRAAKYRHMLDDALGLTDGELALLCVLLLRGSQTPGELKGRTERLHRFESLAEVEQGLHELVERDLVAMLGRRAGQKEDRYGQLLGAQTAAAVDTGPVPVEPQASAADDRVASLEREVQRLRDEVDGLRARLDELDR
jgi:uncharacterized protein